MITKPYTRRENKKNTYSKLIFFLFSQKKCNFVVIVASVF